MTIDFNPSKKQWKAYELLTDKVTNFVGYGGSARSGKTYLLAYFLTIQSLAFPDTGWGLGRRELKNLRRTTLLTLFKVFRDNNLEKDIHYDYNQQNQVITFFNKSQIFLIDTAFQPSDPLYTRFGGLELTGCAVDESNETHYKAIEILFSRVGWRNNKKYGLGRKMLETFNPDKGHVYRRYYEPFKANREKEHIRFIPSLPSDNPDPAVLEWIEDMKKNADEVTIQRLVYGNFEYDDDPSALIDFQKLSDIWTNDFVDSGEGYITADIARFGKDSTVIGIWDGWRLIEINKYEKIGTVEVANIIRILANKNRIPVSNIIVDEDGLGGGVVDQLGCNGFVNNSRPIETETGQEENFNNLKSQCYFRLADKINSSLLYVCDTEYADMIQEELEQIKQHNMDKDGKKMILPKDKVKENIGRSPDFSDMMAMRVWFELGHKWSYSIN